MLRFACFITGDDYQMLKSDTPSSRKKVYTLVSALCLPVLMWGINITLVMTIIMNEPLLISLAGGIIAAAIIFFIERMIIMANGSKMVIAFRIVVGFSMAVLGSVAFDEVIFKADIDQQLSAMKESKKNEVRKAVRQNYAELLHKQDQEMGKRKLDWDQTLTEAQREADGTGGSKQRGISEITRLKLKVASQKETEYQRAKTERDSISQDGDDKEAEAIEKVESEFRDHALLQRIKAMFDLVQTEFFVALIYAFTTLLLFCMEFMVVIVKTKLPKSNYELKIEMIEKIGKRRMERILEGDERQFDHTSQYAGYRKSSSDIGRISKGTLFN